MAASVTWSFEADYFVFCNCDWGCPCNFNARPTLGTCEGASVWRITKGSFGKTRLDGVVFAIANWFPGRIEEGHGFLHQPPDAGGRGHDPPRERRSRGSEQ